jgi:hypothetical protein
MIELHPQIDVGIPPEQAAKVQNLPLLERAKLAVHTFHTLNEAADPYPNSTTDVDELFDGADPLAEIEHKAVNQAVMDLADPKVTQETLNKTLAQVYKYSRPAVKRLDRVLSELDEEIVNVAMRLRAYTTNKLIEESENPDPKVRIKALELLGKVKDVGLFSEKIEITHKTKSDEELEAEIRQRLEVYMGKADVVDAEEVEEAPVVKPLDALKAVVDVKTAAEPTDTP